MNASITEEKCENPWARSLAPKPPRLSLVIASLLYLIASVAIPLAFYSRVAAISAVLLLLAGEWYLVRAARRGVFQLMLLTVAAFVLLQSFLVTTDGYRLVIALSALPISACVGIQSGAFAQTSTRAYWLFPILTAVASGIAFFVTRDWLVSLFPVALWIPALALSVATVRGSYRSVAVCATTLGLLAGVVGLSLLWVFRVSGECSLEAVRSVLGELQAETVELCVALREAYLSEIDAMIEANAHWNAEQIEYANSLMSQLRSTYSDELIGNAVAKAYNLLPSVFFILCAVPAFLAQATLNGAYASNQMRRVLTPESEFFTMSLTSAVIYLIATFVMLTFMSSLSIAVTVADNLCLILMPGFLVLAARGYRKLFSKLRGFGRVVAILAPILLVSCFSIAALPVAALYGAYQRIFAAFRLKISNGMGRGGNGSDS